MAPRKLGAKQDCTDKWVTLHVCLYTDSNKLSVMAHEGNGTTVGPLLHPYSWTAENYYDELPNKLLKDSKHKAAL